MPLGRRKFVLFAIAAALLSVFVVGAGVLGADLYLHHRAERSAGLNRWGYRGPVVGKKVPREIRFAMLGGSTTFGYGGTWNEAIPALLESELRQGDSGRQWTGLNLGYNNEGAYALLPTLQDFDFLQPDIVILYSGYNDLMGDDGPNLAVFRHGSPVFRLTGYSPILPAWLEEKAFALRFGGDLDAAYAAARGERSATVFKPGLAARTSAAALEAAAGVGSSLGHQLDRVAGRPAQSDGAESTRSGCAPPWSHYCAAISRAVEYALGRGRRVLIVDQPLVVEPGNRRAHESQQAALAGMIRSRFSGEARVAYVDLSSAIDLLDTNLSFDRMHLGLDGNRVIATELVEPVRALASGLEMSSAGASGR